jgi:hypothetical protein
MSWSNAIPMRAYEGAKSQHRDQLWFFDFPAEIRNKVYSYTLDIHTTRVPRPPNPSIERHPGFKLLQTCQQIAHEAATLFAQNGRAYIPVTSTLDLQRILRHIGSNQAGMVKPYEMTILSALANMRSLHIHLHVAKLETASDSVLLFNLLWILRNISMNECWADGKPKWGEKKREVLLHLDHFFADDWDREIPQSRCKLPTILNHITANTGTDWGIAYYIHTGHEEGTVMDFIWDVNVTLDWLKLRTGLGYEMNGVVKIVPELRGVGKCDSEKVLGRFPHLTHPKLSLKSTIWPSYDPRFSGPDMVVTRTKIRAQGESCLKQA